MSVTMCRLRPGTFLPLSRHPDNGKKINGRMRHLVVDTKGLPLFVMGTPADLTDRNAAKEVLFRLRLMHPEITIVWADSAYAGQLVTWAKTYLNLTIKTVVGCPYQLLCPSPRSSRHGAWSRTPWRRPVGRQLRAMAQLCPARRGTSGGHDRACLRDWTEAGVWPRLHEVLLAELRREKACWNWMTLRSTVFTSGRSKGSSLRTFAGRPGPAQRQTPPHRRPTRHPAR